MLLLLNKAEDHPMEYVSAKGPAQAHTRLRRRDPITR
jgi:hypothetical protein